MACDKYAQIDVLAGSSGYVAPVTEEDSSYYAFFQEICKRYNIIFSEADKDERDFVIRMAEKGFYKKHA